MDGVRRLHSRGFTLIELLTVVTVISIVFALSAPSIGAMIASARERNVVEKFAQDFDWLRSRATAAAASLTLNGDCTWTATVNGAIDAAHSMSAAALASPAVSINCQAGTVALPATWNFTSQGFATPNGSLTFVGGHGQQWALQVLYSGSIVRAAGAS